MARGPCAKRHVVCVIAVGAHRFSGDNGCANPQSVCPRQRGEDYTKCKTICEQEGHAEIMAVRAAEAAGVDLTGAVATLYGINWICQHCRDATLAAGIRRIYVGQ